MRYLILSMFMVTTMYGWSDNDGLWPRTYRTEGLLLTVYTPEVTGVQGNEVTARGAFSIARDESNMVFGAVSFLAAFEETEPPEMALTSVEIQAIRLPDTLMEQQDSIIQLLRTAVLSWDIRTTKKELADLDNGPAGSGLVSTDLKNDPPAIIIREHPALLVPVAGDPSLKEIKDSPYQYIQNTAVPIIFDPGARRYYLANGRVWYTAMDLYGDWKMSASVPDDIAQLVTLKDDDTSAIAPDLDIVVVTAPTELLVFDGAPQWSPLVGTELLYASNTEGDVFKEVGSGKTFVLLSGRWFEAPSLQGPWSYADPETLPEAFKDIPEGGTKSDVRTSVAGTIEAEEAVLDAYVPTTAAVDRRTASVTIQYDGDPWFQRISGTDMEYAINTTTPVVRIDNRYYAVEDGVWYTSASATGPWAVSDHRPEDVANIPASSPIYNIRYVYVYSATPSTVYVGYTPGYYGTYINNGPVIVYGTGWYYDPWYGPRYYPRPVTWGYHVRYNPYYGWSFGYAFGYGWLHVHPVFWPRYYRMHYPCYYRPPYFRRPAYRPPTYRPLTYHPPTGARSLGASRLPASTPGQVAKPAPAPEKVTTRKTPTISTVKPTTPTVDRQQTDAIRPSLYLPSTVDKPSSTSKPTFQPSTRPSYQPTVRPKTYDRPGLSNRTPTGSVQHPSSRPTNRTAFRPTKSTQKKR